MKTLEQVIENYEDNTLDGRQTTRFAQFLTADRLPKFDLELEEGVTEEEYNKTVKPFTRENVLAQLQKDVEFGFEKALDRRGLSSSFMFECVRFWNWVLEEGLEDWDEDNYPMYGLPLFKATAVKYGWNNPIGDDTGDEGKYGSY